MQTLVVDHEAVAEFGDVSQVVDAVEAAFGSYARGDAQMPPKSYIDLPQYNGDFRSMPAYLSTESWDAAGVKWVNAHPDNPASHGLPTVMGTMIYSDPETAVPLAIMDGTALTRLRTGAAAAVATDYFAVPDASTLGLVGAGAQAYTQLDAIATVRPIESVVVSDPDSTAVDRFVEAYGDAFDVTVGSTEAAARCDVLSTVTPVEEPIVPASALGSRTHVNAMGADAAGKQELETEVLVESTVVIDDYDQCVHSGEINVPYREGAITDENIYAELGEVVVGDKSGRTAEMGVTVFDSTGLAIQDVAAARVVYERACQDENPLEIDLVGVDR